MHGTGGSHSVAVTFTFNNIMRKVLPYILPCVASQESQSSRSTKCLVDWSMKKPALVCRSLVSNWRHCLGACTIFLMQTI